MKPKCAVGKPKVGFSESIPVVSSSYYGTRLKFYLTNSGPRARFQFATDIEQTTWEDDVDEYAPDTSGDPLSLGATVSAAGIVIPSGAITHDTVSECQYWSWSIDGSGNIPINIPRTTRGMIYIAQNITFSTNENAHAGSSIGDIAPTSLFQGSTSGIRAYSTGDRNLQYATDNGSFTPTTADTYTHADHLLSVYQTTNHLLRSATRLGSDSSYQNSDFNTTSPDSLVPTLVFNLMVGRRSSSSVSNTASYVGYLYWAAVP